MTLEIRSAPQSGSSPLPRMEAIQKIELKHSPVVSPRDSTSHLDKKIKDEWLKNLGCPEQYTIWSEKDIEDARKNSKGIKKLIDRQETISLISGSLALAGSIAGMVPTFGPIIGAPLSFFANYYGTYEGAELGFDYARLADARQDLYKDSEKLYTALAIRMIDRYIKSLNAEKAQALEQAHNHTVILLDDASKQKLFQKKAAIQDLAKKVLANLPDLEKQATETLWGQKLRIRPPEEIAKAEEKKKKPKTTTDKIIKAVTITEMDKQMVKNQQQIAKIKKEIQNATLPLKEACRFICGQQTDFSIVILHNERDTMTLRCENRLNSTLRTGLDAIRDKEISDLKKMMNDLMKANQVLAEQLQQKKDKKHHHHHHRSKDKPPAKVE